MIRLALTALVTAFCLAGCSNGALPSVRPIQAPDSWNASPRGTQYALTDTERLVLRPNHLLVANDDSIWYTAYDQPYVAHVQSDGSVRTWRIPAFSPIGTAHPEFIVEAHDGSIWFDYSDSTYQGCYNGIGHIVNNVLKRFHDKSCTGSRPESMTVGSDERIYVVEIGGTGIEAVDNRGVVALYELRYGRNSYASPEYITSGSDGNLWISANPFIVKMELNGYTTFFRVVSAKDLRPYVPSEIADGADGNVWFIERRYDDYHSAISKITPKGHVSQYFLRYPHSPQSLTLGPDHSLWFVDYSAAALIGSVSKAGSFSYYAVSNKLGAEFSALSASAEQVLEVGGRASTKFKRRWFVAKIESGVR